MEKQLSLTSLGGESPGEADSVNLKICPFHMFILMLLQLRATWSNTDTKGFIERLCFWVFLFTVYKADVKMSGFGDVKT